MGFAMERKIVFATNNVHKLREVRSMAEGVVKILSLEDIGCREEIPETADTIAGNALMKARYVASGYGVECFADDTGLEVEALGGAPGVHTARFAQMENRSNEAHDTEANMRLLLEKLQGETNRRARFVTAIAFVGSDGSEKVVEGICEGKIAEERSGMNGFGYDPVFIPDATSPLTFAELDESEKNKVSHRGKAAKKFMEFLLSSKP